MDRAKVRLLEPGDIEQILSKVDDEDTRIFEQGFRMSPEDALRNQFYAGRRMFTGLMNGSVVCIFGSFRHSAIDEDLYLWMLGTPELRKYPVFFMKLCLPVMKMLVGDAKRVYAIMDPENARAGRWLKRLGFQDAEGVQLHGDQMFPRLKLETSWLS